MNKTYKFYNATKELEDTFTFCETLFESSKSDLIDNVDRFQLSELARRTADNFINKYVLRVDERDGKLYFLFPNANIGLVILDPSTTGCIVHFTVSDKVLKQIASIIRKHSSYRL